MQSYSTVVFETKKEITQPAGVNNKHMITQLCSKYMYVTK